MIIELPLSRSSADHSSPPFDSILTIVNRFSKRTHFIPTQKTMDTKEYANIIIQEVIRHHSVPDSILSDHRTIFSSCFWWTLSKALGITVKLTTAYHPQGDSQTEIHNRTIKQMLHRYINFQQDNWVDLLPILEFRYNNSKNTSTGYTPFFVDTRRHPKPWALSDINFNGALIKGLDRAEELRELHEIIRNNIERAQAAQAKYYNTKHKPTQFKVGCGISPNVPPMPRSIRVTFCLFHLCQDSSIA